MSLVTGRGERWDMVSQQGVEPLHHLIACVVVLQLTFDTVL